MRHFVKLVWFIRKIYLESSVFRSELPRTAVRLISLILLAFSAFGVTFSGPLILGWTGGSTQFFDLGPTATLLGGYLDIVGGVLEFVMLAYMARTGHFSANVNRLRARRSFKIMAGICVIGVIADPLGGLLAIAAQIGLYTSLANVYLYRTKSY